jgi:hypothetical protein
MWARIIDNGGVETVAEVIDFDPATAFLPSVAVLFIPATDGMVYRAEKRDGAWVPPPSPEPDPEPQPAAPKFRTTVSRAEYYGLFTPVEEAMIRLTAATPVTLESLTAATGAEKQKLIAVSALKVMLSRTDALDSDKAFDLASAQVGEGLNLLVTLGLLSVDRKVEILKGVPE